MLERGRAEGRRQPPTRRRAALGSERCAEDRAGTASFAVGTVADDLVAEGGPEGEGAGVVVEHGEAYGGAAGLAEPGLDQRRQPPSVALPLRRRVDQQEPDPRVGVGGVGVVREGDRDADEGRRAVASARPVGDLAGEEDLHIRVGQLQGQRRVHLLGADVVGVGEVAAEGVERPVGGVQGGELGEEGTGDGPVHGGAEGFEQQHAPHAADGVGHRPARRSRRAPTRSAARPVRGGAAGGTPKAPHDGLGAWGRAGPSGVSAGVGQTLTPKSWAMPTRPEA
ncbi:hypothetical protein GCM10027075_70610 [Streptomyces heilongjiangensis]